MNDQQFMQSHCRPDGNWFVIHYDVWVFTQRLTARQIWQYVFMDQGKW